MLNNLENIINKLSAFSFTDEQTNIIEENKDALADLQAEQWAQSKNRDGRELQLLDNPQFHYGYTPFTIAHKRLRNTGLAAVTQRITLFETGETYRTLFATITNGLFTLSAQTPYFDAIMLRTNGAAGLDEDERLSFAEAFVVPGMKARFKEKTGLVIK